MSQKIKYLTESTNIELKVKVTINSISNHNGFFEGQVDQAVLEFKEKVKEELENYLIGKYQQCEFLQSVDFVSYDISTIN